MPDFHTHEFTPWTIDGDRTVLHDWPQKPWTAGSIVRVGCDVFAEHDGPVVDERGRRLGHVSPCDPSYFPIVVTEPAYDAILRVELTDLRRDLSPVFDGNPDVWFLLETERPGAFWQECPYAAHETGRFQDPIANVALAVTVRNQHDADRLLPELIRCRDLCGRLVVYYTGEGAVDWGRLPFVPVCPDCGSSRCQRSAGDYKCESMFLPGETDKSLDDSLIARIDTTIIRGSDSAPTDLDAVRDTVRQCGDVVGCWIESMWFDDWRESHGGTHMSPFINTEIPDDLRAVNERFHRWEVVNV